MGKNKFLVEFDDGNKRDIGYFLLVQVCSEYGVGYKVNNNIYDTS